MKTIRAKVFMHLKSSHMFPISDRLISKIFTLDQAIIRQISLFEALRIIKDPISFLETFLFTNMFNSDLNSFCTVII